MRDLIQFFAVLVVSFVDPVVIIPAIVAAIWRKWWLPVVVGAAAGLVSQLIAIELGAPADLMGMKILAGATLGGIVAGLAPLVRKIRGKPLDHHP